MSLLFNLVLIGIITPNAIAIILHTVPANNRQYTRLFQDFKVFSVTFFSVEYTL